MKLKDIFPPGEGFLDLKSRERNAILRELVQHLVRVGELAAEKEAIVLRKLFDREELGSTDIGGIAVPHAKVENGLLKREIVLIVGYSSEPIMWHENSPFELNLVYLLLSDEKLRSGMALDALATIAQLPRDPGPNGYNWRRILNGE